ncbi:MAG TPA: BMP family protein [Candidatus Acidoferrales bacterium]|jgi:basic membrane protein A|nr:BMP family protein [Candidatus Acidoferrales bacterium]
MSAHRSIVSRRNFNRIMASLLFSAGLSSSLAAGKQTISVALLLSGVITDGGWGQLAYNGLSTLKSRGFRTAYAENISLAQMDQVTRGYADDGFDLIIGHGGEFSSTFLEVAPDYPKQRFFVTTFLPQGAVSRNLMYVNMGYFSAAYGAGVLAALISVKKQAVGYIGGADDPNQQRMKKAFIAGAQHAVPGIRAMGIITGDYDNAAKGREAASILIGNGADVIWHSADITGLGAIQGAAAGNIKAIGCYSDQSALAPNNVATSFELNLSGMVIKITEQVLSGTFAGGTEWRPPVDEMWLLKNGPNGSYNPHLITSAEWAAFQDVWRDIAARRIDVDKFAAF